MSKEVTKKPANLMIEDAEILFRNFEGIEGQYNRAGDRNFHVILEPELARQMEEDGWNVKYLKQREEDEVPKAHIQVSVSYRNRPPTIVLITERFDRHTGGFVKQRTTLPEELLMMVDYADIAKADLVINPYVWSVPPKSGIKAYLKTLFVTIRQDELEKKYAGIEEVQWNGAPLEIAQAPHDLGDEDIVLEEQEDGSYS